MRDTRAWSAINKAVRAESRRSRKERRRAQRAVDQALAPIQAPSPAAAPAPPAAPTKPADPQPQGDDESPSTGRELLRRAVEARRTDTTRLARRCLVRVEVIAGWLAGASPDFSRRKMLEGEIAIPTSMPW